MNSIVAVRALLIPRHCWPVVVESNSRTYTLRKSRGMRYKYPWSVLVDQSLVVPWHIDTLDVIEHRVPNKPPYYFQIEFLRFDHRGDGWIEVRHLSEGSVQEILDDNSKIIKKKYLPSRN